MLRGHRMEWWSHTAQITTAAIIPHVDRRKAKVPEAIDFHPFAEKPEPTSEKLSVRMADALGIAVNADHSTEGHEAVVLRPGGGNPQGRKGTA